MDKTLVQLLFERRSLLITTFAICLLIFVSQYALLKRNQYDYLSHSELFKSFLKKIRFINDTSLKKFNLSTYAVCKSQLSEPLICNKLGEGRISVFNKQNLVNWGVFVSDNWGNSLSPYWQARGAAFLMGNSFACGSWNTAAWMKFLPISVSVSVSVASLSSNSCINAYPELFRLMCIDCGPNCNMVYAHKCVGAWNHIRDQIQQNTRSAIEQWAVINNKTIPFFNTSEMVMFDRCSKGTVLDHPEHGPLAYSAFLHVPKTVKILYQVYAEASRTSLCNALRQAQISYLKRVRPDITVIHSPGSIWEDFAKLVYAPYVLIISAGSSFALWSTLANVGHVWTPPLYGGMTPDVGSNFHWINTPVLYPYIGQSLNLTDSGNVKDNNNIIEWLKNR
jgi:hypothetical protein